MSKKMLIDASHREETRVVVLDGSKVEDFDFESAAKKPIRGNIYLAKVTRVEPSLQAAFVEYGGNRHGFLAFNEIHPDYYQIPTEDRAALEAEVEAESRAAAKAESEDEEEVAEEASEDAVEAAEDGAEAGEDDGDSEADSDQSEEAAEVSGDDEDGIDEAALERKRRQFYRKYKIQEVIKRRQILLVQVAKEERGNKGAALTTYLSLAGRYCVLMPNTPRGGGISRKISSASDRKRLKGVVGGLDLPKGMGLIIRTAGASRTKTEIKRDADYLLRLWTQIREDTMQAVAPSLIHAEGDLVKRAIRDMYDKEIESVLVEGEDAYKQAKSFIKMLMPSHAKKVQQYKDAVPLLLRHRAEAQLEAIYSPVAPLKSGGYLVINPTEALVSIDVNSGRATRERNIEATALRTNLEAAEEAARQMRLRDLAGLIVIDFIDMEENKNNRAVEKKMKDVLKRDRARLQVGRISQFGLMEISRQRRRTSLIEGSTTTCPTCNGAGFVRSVESSALVALRTLEEEGLKGRAKRLRISVATSTALYLLNEKREHLLSIESRFDLSVFVAADDTQTPPECRIDVLEQRSPDNALVLPAMEEVVEEEDEDASAETDSESEEEPREGGRRRRRRRRRRGSGSSESAEIASETAETSAEAAEGEVEDASADGETPSEEAGEEGSPRRRRRRGRRGGRNRRRSEETSTETAEAPEGEEAVEAAAETEVETEDAPEAVAEAAPETTPEAAAETAAEEEKPKRKRSPRKRAPKAEAKPAEEAAAEAPAETAEAPAEAEAEAEKPAEEEKPKRKRSPRKRAPAKAKDAEAAPAEESKAEEPAPAEAEAEAEKPAEEEKPKRKRSPRKRAPAKAKDAEAAPAEEAKADEAAPAEAEAEAETPVAEEKPKRKRSPRKRAPAKAAEPVAVSAPAAAEATEAAEPVRESAEAEPADAEAGEDGKPSRKGWWQRTGLFGR
jgi:ribonuclease E